MTNSERELIGLVCKHGMFFNGKYELEGDDAVSALLLVQDVQAERADLAIVARLVEARKERESWLLEPRPDVDDRSPDWTARRQEIIDRQRQQEESVRQEVGDDAYRYADAAYWRAKRISANG